MIPPGSLQHKNNRIRQRKEVVNSSYLHSIDSSITTGLALANGKADYFYTGVCPRTSRYHCLPRTPLAKAVAMALMQHLRESPEFNQEGKMYGVLLVRAAQGETVFLKAFSGLLQGQGMVPGWVPPIPGRDRVALQEAYTLTRLNYIKQRLQELQQIPERQVYACLAEDLNQRRQRLNQHHRYRKQERQRQRQMAHQSYQGKALQEALFNLDQQSRGDKAELRAFKQNKAQQLNPLAEAIRAADEEILLLKQQRRDLSCQLQVQMRRSYSLTNFAGQSLAVQDLAGKHGLPTGTGECCAPKLLHFAADHDLLPVAMAEFWWGPDAVNKQAGEFYGACAERCQPIMGFMLAGLSAEGREKVPTPDPTLPILYEDDWLVAVSKPFGLLSVPGRYGHCQDSVLSRLRNQLPDGSELVAVHRLDQDTSGVLILARHKAAERYLRRQFQDHQVVKCYEAVLAHRVTSTEGTITLPLWGNPQERPRQSVHWQRGKPCVTRYQVIALEQETTRVLFYPITGRTHQLRVHAAHPEGLNAPIVGDRLYGNADGTQRLHLHAREIRFWHPVHDKELTIRATTPF